MLVLLDNGILKVFEDNRNGRLRSNETPCAASFPLRPSEAWHERFSLRIHLIRSLINHFQGKLYLPRSAGGVIDFAETRAKHDTRRQSEIHQIKDIE